MRRTERGARRGVALVTALGGIILIGVIMGGVVFMSTQESRIAHGMFATERAFRAAEGGLNTAIVEWNAPAMLALEPGSLTERNLSGEDWQATVRITKLTPRLVSLVSTATVNPGTPWEARKSTGLNVRIANVAFNILGALTVRGQTRIGGSSFISGFDTEPNPSWQNCGPLGEDLAGVTVPDADSLRWTGCPSMKCVEGSPTFKEDPAAADTTTYFSFGDLDWESLTALASKVYPGNTSVGSIAPVESNGVCLTSVQNNWGQPLRTDPPGACESYFPIIHFKGPGTVKITSGGTAQGIMLVDGDLEMSGGLEFFGPVIVRGYITTTGGGGRVRGAVMAANVDFADNTVLGDATVRYSSCAIEQASAAAALPLRLAERAWLDIH